VRNRTVMKFKFGPSAVGIKVAKDFADGVWFGEVSKYCVTTSQTRTGDGGDVGGGIYTILFTDGDGDGEGWRRASAPAA
jgi:hypothetical protein